MEEIGDQGSGGIGSAEISGGPSSPLSEQGAAEFQSKVLSSDSCTKKSRVKGHQTGLKADWRCSIGHVHEVISKFDQKKMQLVRSIGFDGLLHFPDLRQLNRRFSMWLMNRVDQVTKHLVIDGHTRIKFSKDDIGVVFGIPSSGRRVHEDGLPSKETIRRIMDRYIGADMKGSRSIKAAQEVIERQYDGHMSEDEEDSFRVAFVVYVMSTLLAPGAKYDYVAVDYWNALVVPSLIRNYDWADYVMQRLLDAVLKLKSDRKSVKKIPNISGCSLFLQVLYLDSIELGSWILDHNTFPRVRCFSSERIRSMILADSGSTPADGVKKEFGNSRLRIAYGLCYSWAHEFERNGLGHVKLGNVALWEATISLARALNVPLEATGPLYIAVADFEKESSNLVGFGGAPLVNAIFSIIEPYLKGFSYNAGVECDYSDFGESSGGSGLGDDQNSGCCRGVMKRSLGDYDSGVVSTVGCQRRWKRHCSKCVPVSAIVPNNMRTKAYVDNWNAHVFVRRVMHKYYTCIRRSKAATCIDLNVTSYDGGSECVSCPRIVRRHLADPKTPWQLGGEWMLDCFNVPTLLKDFATGNGVDDNELPWLVHFVPKFIAVKPIPLKEQLKGRSEMEMDLFDAVIRRFKQIDDRLYAHQIGMRWRHFVESDFMGSIVAGCFDVADRSIRDQFIGNHVDYDVPNCKLIFFPLLLEHRWVCYAWSLEDNTITIFDPSGSFVPSVFLDSSHNYVTLALKAAMRDVADNYFIGWDNEWDCAKTRFIRLPDSGAACLNRTGVLCAYFCRTFDGEKMVPELVLDEVEGIAAMVLGEVIQLDDNFGKNYRGVLHRVEGFGL